MTSAKAQLPHLLKNRRQRRVRQPRNGNLFHKVKHDKTMQLPFCLPFWGLYAHARERRENGSRNGNHRFSFRGRESA
jgi:hypothetical protein